MKIENCKPGVKVQVKSSPYLGPWCHGLVGVITGAAHGDLYEVLLDVPAGARATGLFYPSELRRAKEKTP